ncbi:MAG: type II and III secretion system protein family protein, partial [Rhodospirillales bacterium]
VKPEVTSLDFANGVNIFAEDVEVEDKTGFVVPALVTRRAETTIELRDGQTFAIAGLLQNNFSDDISQLPWLGDVPILGLLFRSSKFKRNETELVILVTPYLVKPAPAQAVAAPTDTFVPPSDADIFVFGLLEAPESGRGKASGGQGAGGMSGRSGHIIK